MKLESKWPVTDVEIHHINGRISDEDWNLISLCREHHRRGTSHDLEHGRGSKQWNSRFMALKVLKGEMTLEKVEELQVTENVATELKTLYEGESYWRGIREGWYQS